MGAIYDKAKAIIPITWSALEADSKMGQTALQEEIEVVKLDVFGQLVYENDEEDYDIRVQKYIAKLAVLAIISAGIDYWNDAYQTVSTQGGPAVEIASYPDRIKGLELIRERLIIEVAKERAKIEELLGVTQTVSSVGVPAVSDGGTELEGFVTPNPTKEFRDYAFDGRRARRFTRGPW